MSEKKCRKCDAVLSPLVRVCPQCGARVATGTGTEIGLVIGLLVLAGAVVVVVKASNNGARPAGSGQTVSLAKPAPPPVQPAPPPPTPAPVVVAPPPEPAPQEKPQLDKGMSMDKVRQLWGDPVKESLAASSTVRSDWWTYADGTKLHFVNSVLDSWEMTTPPVLPAPAVATLPPVETPPGVAAVPPGAGAPGPVFVPPPDVPHPAPPSAESIRAYGELEAVLKRAEVEDAALHHPPGLLSKLQQTYTANVRLQSQLTEAQQQAILTQGDAQGWPMINAVFGPEPGGTPVSPGTTYAVGTLLELLPGQMSPEMGGQKIQIPPGALVIVLSSLQNNGNTWYRVQATGPGVENGPIGWAANLTAMTKPVTINGVIPAAGP